MFAKSSPDKPGTRKRLVLGLCLLTIGAGLATFALLARYAAWGHEPAQLSPDEFKEALQGDPFAGLSPEERAKRLEDMGRLMPDMDREQRRKVFRDGSVRGSLSDLSPEERRKLLASNRESQRDRRREEMQKRINDFFEASAEEQERILQEFLDRMQHRRRRPPGSENTNRSQRQRSTRTEEQHQDRLRNMLDDTEPEDRAKTTEFFRRLSEMAEEQGIEMGGGPMMRR